MELTIVQVIQSMLAPGIMISACGLLLLGMNSKYSLVVNRIRLLNEEKRKTQVDIEKQERLDAINIQLPLLKRRLILIRNAVFFYSIGVAVFIMVILVIGIKFLVDFQFIPSIIIILFIIGILFVLAGIINAAIEVWKGYKIVGIEIESVK